MALVKRDSSVPVIVIGYAAAVAVFMLALVMFLEDFLHITLKPGVGSLTGWAALFGVVLYILACGFALLRRSHSR